MKKIQDEEFREYLEYKRFMGEAPGQARKSPGRRLNMEDLDQVRAASGNREYELFLREIQKKMNGED